MEARRRIFLRIATLELCERFGFYGLQSVSILYFVKTMGLSEQGAIMLWGAFSALMFGVPVLGGWLGDRILGARRTVAVALALLATGYTGLASGVGGAAGISLVLAVLVCGGGIFKPNITSLLRHAFSDGDDRLDIVFTIYYMSINIGATIAALAIPFLAVHIGWRASFGVSSAVLWAGFAVSLTLPATTPAPTGAADRRLWLLLAAGIGAAFTLLHYPTLARTCIWIAATAILLIWIVLYRRAAPAWRAGLKLSFALQAEAILFFLFNQQIATSLTGFARDHVAGTIHMAGMDWIVQPGQFQSLNNLWILIFAPCLAALYHSAARKGRPISVPIRFLCGFVLLTGSFILWRTAALAGAAGPVSPWWMVAGYALFSLGELLIAALGLAVIARYAPPDAVGRLMGCFSVLGGLASYLGSLVATDATYGAAGTGTASTAGYTHLFGNLAALAAIVALASALFIPFARRMDAHWRRALLTSPSTDETPPEILP
ncbi:peptide MFS transporter [Gluconacetobacter sp. 1b LMG 1731]|uniref:Peptide MFS transporter n=1 Tax=Gluconacetobacter dulcium TaxID=2729096 RepID=A0A7W4NR52_9PROT|nr:peptide MFS transporter [Gluconacetobacter dulcium]MBB2163229.1 peptide MFS transporter [Gluconacetobacter dulcium]MBB2192076.1 peptide MFS transporter [Gluconacetobacter dulcium]